MNSPFLKLGKYPIPLYLGKPLAISGPGKIFLDSLKPENESAYRCFFQYSMTIGHTYEQASNSNFGN